MSEPFVADVKPQVMDLEPGTYHYCTCGRSAKKSFCDGSHAGTEFRPLAFTVAEKRKAAICLCKHTHTPPYCDGAHSKFR